MATIELAHGTPSRPADEQVLTDDAMAFLAELAERFAPRVQQLLRAREQRQQRLDAGELPDFLPETQAVRDGDWRIAASRRICWIDGWKSPGPPIAR